MRTNEQAAQKQSEMETLYPQESLVYAEFQEIRYRKKSVLPFLNR